MVMTRTSAGCARFVVMFGLIGLAGCSSKPNANAVAEVTPEALHSGPPVTADDAKQFAVSLENALKNGSAPVAESLFRMNEIVERSASDLNFRPQMISAFRKGIAGPGGGGIQQQIMGEIQKGGSYKLLRIREIDGTFRPLFRFISPDQGVNYHEFTLNRYPDGKIGASDIYIYLTGERFTQTIRKLLIPLAKEANRGVLDRVKGSERLLIDNGPKLEQLAKSARSAENSAQALAVYRSLPDELLKSKSVQVLAMLIAQRVSDDDYQIEMERFRSNHPNDPAVDFVSIDYFLMKKEYDKSIGCIDRLDQAVGGDPFLNFLRGSALMTAERMKDAKAKFEKAIQFDPTLSDPYWGLVTLSLKEKKHEETLTALKNVIEKFNVDIDESQLGQDENYRDFVKSPQCKELKEWLKSRQK
jgi:tetratricopeptide (TPR) repeat protein